MSVKWKYGLLSHKKRVLLRKYQLMQPTYTSNIGLYHAMYIRYIFISALLWSGPILLTRRPWPYVIHHLHFMNIYRMYIAWYRPILLVYVGCINWYVRNKTLFSFMSGQCVYIWVKVEYHKIIWPIERTLVFEVKWYPLWHPLES
jgi:hypothetical protein